MRISDWSSDVCSSDLAFFRQVLLEPAQVIVLGDAGAEDEEALRPRLGDGEVADDLAGGIQHRREHQAAFSRHAIGRSEEHTSELQSLMRISYAVFCLKKKTKKSITK